MKTLRERRMSLLLVALVTVIGCGAEAPGEAPAAENLGNSSDTVWSPIRFPPSPPAGLSFVGGPAISSWGPNRLDIFQRASNNFLYHAWSNDGGVTYVNNAWEPLFGYISSDPAAFSWGYGRIDVFARGPSGQLYHGWWNGARWSAEDIGMTQNRLAGAPSVATWQADYLEVVGRDSTTGKLMRTWYNGYANPQWNRTWEISDSPPLGGDPALASWGAGRLDAFAQDYGGNLVHGWHGLNWVWETKRPANIWLSGAPAAISRGYNRLDVFVRDYYGSLYQLMWPSNEWYTNTWYKVPFSDGVVGSSPRAVRGPNDRVDLVYRYGAMLGQQSWW